MKKLLFILFLTVSVSAVFSQSTLSFGPAVGANYSWVSEMDDNAMERKWGALAGLQLTYSNVNNWGIGLGAFYSREGVKQDVAGAQVKTELNYIRVPLKGIIFFRDLGDQFRPKIFVGPTFGYLTGGETEFKPNGEVIINNSRDVFDHWDVGLLGGLGINIRMSEMMWFNFDAGYTYGLTNLTDGGDASNRNVHTTVGLAFGL